MADGGTSGGMVTGMQGRWQVGDVTITRFVEIEMTGGMSRIIPPAVREEVVKIDWLKPHFADEEGRMRGAIQTFVLDTPSGRVMVDTCLGNDKQRAVPAWNMMQTRFLEEMSEAGFPPESIDVVLCTHLHVDHVGWNTRLVDGKWVPTFTNARYLYGREEFEFWKTSDRAGQPEIMADSVYPVYEAGLVDMVEVDEQIMPELRLVHTPGHTPGHVSLWIESQGERAMITGDFLHHPCQMARPNWSSAPDTDPEMSKDTRRKMFAELADGPILMIGTHFATPAAGQCVKDGDDSWRLDV